MSNEAAALTVTRRTLADSILIEAVGQVDLITAKVLKEALAESVQATVNAASTASVKQAPLRLDLRQVDFIDSAGLALLVTAGKRLSSASSSLEVLLTPGQQPDRVLKLGQFHFLLTLTYPAPA